MADSDFLIWLGTEVRRFLQPVTAAVESEDAFADLLTEYGWSLNPTTLSIGSIRSALGIANDLTTAEQVLQTVLAAGTTPTVDQVVQMVQALQALVSDVQQLTTAAGSPPSGFPAAAWSSFTQDLPPGLVADYLEHYHARAFAGLLLAGVITETEVQPPTGSTDRVAYVQRAVDWGRLGDALTKPQQLMHDVYGWADQTAGFDSQLALDRMKRVWELLGLTTATRTPSTAVLDAFYSPGNPQRASAKELVLLLMDATNPDSNASLQAGIWVLPAPPQANRGGAPTGLAFGPSITGSADGEEMLWPVSLELTGELASDNAVTLELQPGSLDATVNVGASGKLDAGAVLSREGDRPAVLVGSPLSHRIQAYGGGAGLRVSGPLTDLELQLEFGFDRLQLIFDPGNGGDSFIGKILGSGPQTVEFDGTLLWSSKQGISFKGHAELKLIIGINLSIAVVEIDTLTLDVGVDTGGQIAIAAGVTGKLTLGPVDGTVQNIGVKALLQPAPAGGTPTFGEMDLTFGFKPPDGLGLEVDAVVVKGGGFLSFNDQEESYAGVLELAIEDVIQIKAIGLLTTKMPDGSHGFSLLVILTAQFPAIQLGFGFALTGLGGLAGINRTIDTEALRSGVRNGTVSSIMFPDDPVANAPKIVSDVGAVFPPAVGRYVFGPMVELAWGTPPIITAELGVIIELPPPIVLVILGRIKAVLPTEDEAVVKIHLDAAGIIEFEKQTASVDASLFDSEIAEFPVAGDMALRMNWSDHPNFALSVGGLNPRYQPPPGFPELRRLSLTMGDGDNPRLTCDTYLAVTANSVQFGAHVEAKAEAAGFAVHGFLAFDALFILSPFSMIVEMHAGVDLLRGSSVLMTVHLDFTLSGPDPWHAVGSATAHVLFIDVSVAFDAQWGDPTQAALPQADAEAPLLAAIGQTGNWSAQAPSDSEKGATFGTGLAVPQNTILVHPFGRLTFRQKVVPFDVTISRFGSAPPSGANNFTVADVSYERSGGLSSQQHTPVQDYFARGQFFDMSDDDKLAKDSYEQLNSGFVVGSGDVETGATVSTPVEYENILVDDPVLPARIPPAGFRLYTPGDEVYGSLISQGAGAVSAVRTTGAAKFVEPGTASSISVSDVRYVVASTSDLSVRTDVAGADGTTQVEADIALAEHLASHPEDEGEVQVVPTYEAVG